VVQRERNIIIMHDNYVGNGSNHANGFQIDRYFFDTCSAYKNSHSKQSNFHNNNEKTPYELWKGRPENVKHFRVFGSKCYIKREGGRMEKFDSHVDKGVLVGYSSTRKEYKCYNTRLNKFVESINVTIDKIGGQELKEEENESMEQLYEKEEEDEEEVQGKDEEDQT
jgi:hypothetical protein